MRLLPVHRGALLVELDDLQQTLGLLASLQAEPIDGIDEIVPGARTLLLGFRPERLPRAALVAQLRSRPLDLCASAAGALVEIPVHYDGEDLAEVAGLLGLGACEVVRRHTGCEWFVAFTGFAPGFAYLSGGDPLLNVPRRASPRTRIPAGAVALAGGFSAVYPKASPGGWQIVGQTSVPMWDLSRDPPALLHPGQRVRFIDAGPRPAQAGPVRTAAVARPTSSGTALEIVSTGLQALLQDLGRPGQAAQGVAASGAMDRGSLRAANRLVGNAAGTACIETVQGGLMVQSRGTVVVAVTGATGPLTLTGVDGIARAVPRHAPLALDDGDRLALGEPCAGVHSYLAVRGGFAVAPVLGSLAFDSLADVGPPPLATGDRLAVHAPARGAVALPDAAPDAGWPGSQDTVTLDVTLGPRTDWFTPEAVALFVLQTWTVTPQSNRVGLRLAGEQPLARAKSVELPSEGTVLGAIQVPASGQPVLFLADHPLTGGYPVIACIVPRHLDLAGQLPVGVRVKFRVLADGDALDLRLPAAASSFFEQGPA